MEKHAAFLPAWRPVRSLPGLRRVRYWNDVRRYGAETVTHARALHSWLRVSYINSNIYIAPDRKYIYIAAPKNATTSLKIALHEMEGDQSLADLPHKTNHSIQHAHRRDKNSLFLSPQDIGWRAFRALLDDPGCFKFTFVRNPYVRFASSWRHQVEPFIAEERNQQAERFAPGRAKRRKQRTRTLYGPAGYFIFRPSFAEFSRAVCQQNALYHDPHWMPQSDCLYIDRIRYDFIGQLERLNEDWEKLAAKLNKSPPPMRQINLTVKTTTPLSTLYTPELRDMIYKKYARDFEVFGYSASLPG